MDDRVFVGTMAGGMIGSVAGGVCSHEGMRAYHQQHHEYYGALRHPIHNPVLHNMYDTTIGLGATAGYALACALIGAGIGKVISNYISRHK